MTTPLRTPLPRPGAGVRVVCFPHAGGSAAYFGPWARHLPADVELVAVQYPGRADRVGETPHTTMSGLAAEATAAIGALRWPVVLFGHSMGAAVAYEVAGALAETSCPPAALVVSGREAPHLAHGGTVHTGADEALTDELHRLGGTPGELLASPDFAGVFLPTVRADYTLIERYRPIRPGPLPCPIDAWGADADPDVAPSEVRAWGRYTTGGFTTAEFAGGHFFHESNIDAVIDRLLDTTDRATVLPSAPAPVAAHPADRRGAPNAPVSSRPARW